MKTNERKRNENESENENENDDDDDDDDDDTEEEEEEETFFTANDTTRGNKRSAALADGVCDDNDARDDAKFCVGGVLFVLWKAALNR